MTNEYYALTTKEALTLLKTSETGLTGKEAKKRLDEYGYNELQKIERSQRSQSSRVTSSERHSVASRKGFPIRCRVV